MKLGVYVDAFNFYYGCLLGTAHKWLNLEEFCKASFPNDQVEHIRYSTARIPANLHDPDKPVRQDTYFRALRTTPIVSIHEGHYLTKPVFLPQHPIPAPPTPMTMVQVVKNEQKGSDVNLATNLLIDAMDGAFEGAVVVTNDSDLALPIQMVRTRLKKKVFVLHSCSRPGRSPSIHLRRASGLRSGKSAAHRPERVAGREPVRRPARRRDRYLP